MNEPSIVVEMTPMGHGKAHAFADVTLVTALGEITIKGCRVLRPEGKEPWVAFPSTSYNGADGKPRYKDVLEFSRGLRAKMVELLLAEYKKLRIQA